MTASTITNVVQQRARQVGLAPLSPQDLRRTTIHDLIESGVSLTDVHRRFGFVSHLTLATRYDHRDSQTSAGGHGWPVNYQDSLWEPASYEPGTANLLRVPLHPLRGALVRTRSSRHCPRANRLGIPASDCIGCAISCAGDRLVVDRETPTQGKHLIFASYQRRRPGHQHPTCVTSSASKVSYLPGKVTSPLVVINPWDLANAAALHADARQLFAPTLAGASAACSSVPRARVGNWCFCDSVNASHLTSDSPRRCRISSPCQYHQS
jgi:hypothetical protein